jgi:hypothetical protein
MRRTALIICSIVSIACIALTARIEAQEITDAAAKQAIIEGMRAVILKNSVILDRGVTATVRSASIARLYDSLWRRRGAKNPPPAPTFTITLDQLYGPRCQVGTYTPLANRAARQTFKEEVKYAEKHIEHLFECLTKIPAFGAPPSGVDVTVERDSSGYIVRYTVEKNSIITYVRDDFRVSEMHMGGDRDQSGRVAFSYAPTSAGPAMETLTLTMRNRGVDISARMRMQSEVFEGVALPTQIRAVATNLLAMTWPSRPGTSLDDTLSITGYQSREK